MSTFFSPAVDLFLPLCMEFVRCMCDVMGMCNGNMGCQNWETFIRTAVTAPPSVRRHQHPINMWLVRRVPTTSHPQKHSTGSKVLYTVRIGSDQQR